MSFFKSEIYKVYKVAVNPASIATVSSSETAVTIPCNENDVVFANYPSGMNDDILFIGARVSAKNTVQVRLYNPTGGSIDPASATWTFVVFSGLAG
jgi:hypothetical protein